MSTEGMMSDYMMPKYPARCPKKRKVTATEDTKEDIVIDVIADIIARDLLRDPDYVLTDKHQIQSRTNFSELCRINERYEELKRAEKDGKEDSRNKGDTNTNDNRENFSNNL